ncbi:MAG: hypothetical protein Q9P01_22600 [Anaerolineae bacterium]|nr:hypothetical protein [Anaerolineae bacterium]
MEDGVTSLCGIIADTRSDTGQSYYLSPSGMFSFPAKEYIDFILMPLNMLISQW